MKKINVVIVGAGHYSTGYTSLSGKKKTDKDFGVILPSILELKKLGYINKIALVAKNGSRLKKIRNHFFEICNSFDWDMDISTHPSDGKINPKEYIQVLKNMPKPCAALIAIPDALHKEVILECIENNIDFLVMKPAVTNLSDFYEIRKKLNDRHLVSMVDYHKVFDDANIVINNEFNSGEYGKLHHYHSLMTQRRDMLKIFSRSGKVDSLNVNHYLGSHYIHLLGFFTDATPIDVRATQQFGLSNKVLNSHSVADFIHTNIRWKDKKGNIFTSYHTAGWIDPEETESMTFQELHMLTDKGHIDSDQRYRGFRKILSDSGYDSPNPYFFNLKTNFLDSGLESQYGFKSIKNFVLCSINKNNGLDFNEKKMPTFLESEKVTAILEAADLSLSNNSSIIKITQDDNSLVIKK